MRLNRIRGRVAFGRRPHDDGDDGSPPRALVVALLLACGSLMALDYGDDSPVIGPARQAVGEVFGPAQSGVASAIRPIVQLPDRFETNDNLRAQLTTLEAENAELRGQVRTRQYDLNRLEEYEGLTATAEQMALSLVPARVIGVGAAQSFSYTVTIDAGSDAGISPDMTVLNNDGLVGRVLRTTHSTATVLLIVDPDSVVGGRVGESMDLGFLHGRGEFSERGRLDLQLVDRTAVPSKRDTVVTWGSADGTGPYVPGIPVGEVVAVYESLRDSSQRVVIDPYVDFGSLDLVGVVVPAGTESDRGLIEAGGTQ